jgi:hypothetical protein
MIHGGFSGEKVSVVYGNNEAKLILRYKALNVDKCKVGTHEVYEEKYIVLAKRTSCCSCRRFAGEGVEIDALNAVVRD